MSSRTTDMPAVMPVRFANLKIMLRASSTPVLYRPLVRVLLVFDVFLPELVPQLRIRLFLRGFADLPGNDIVIAAVRNILGRGIRSATAFTSAASGAAAAAGALAVGLHAARARGAFPAAAR